MSFAAAFLSFGAEKKQGVYNPLLLRYCFSFFFIFST